MTKKHLLKKLIRDVNDCMEEVGSWDDGDFGYVLDLLHELHEELITLELNQ